MKSVVGVAQLVEPRIVIPVVVGSSPIVHPTDIVIYTLQVAKLVLWALIKFEFK